MSIKGIGQGSPYEQIRIQQEQDRARAGAGGVKDSSPSETDGVTVSQDARLRAVARKAATDAPEVREDKVARLKALVESGQYQVDSRAVAGGIVDEELRIFEE